VFFNALEFGKPALIQWFLETNSKKLKTLAISADVAADYQENVCIETPTFCDW